MTHKTQVDFNAALQVMNESLRHVKTSPVNDCPIKETIDLVLQGKNCLTYRYIMMTALVAKSTEQSIDVLSLQASNESSGAYDARSLCRYVVFPFQKKMLGNALDGSNEDPLVNNPGRHPRISKSNKSAGGDPKKALFALCDDLPTIETSDVARLCLEYAMSRCLDIAEDNQAKSDLIKAAAATADVSVLRTFFSDLLDKTYGGAALTLVTTCLYRMLFAPTSGFTVVPHPVNQSGGSGRQLGDLDVFLDDEPYLATELKDKPFTEAEVSKAASTAFDNHSPALLFVAGRSSGFSDDAHRYLEDAKKEYEKRGMFVGATTIDALTDTVFAFKRDISPLQVFSDLDNLIVEISVAPEVQTWIYGHLASMDVG
jgi:hypothetical protein